MLPHVEFCGSRVDVVVNNATGSEQRMLRLLTFVRDVRTRRLLSGFHSSRDSGTRGTAGMRLMPACTRVEHAVAGRWQCTTRHVGRWYHSKATVL